MKHNAPGTLIWVPGKSLCSLVFLLLLSSFTAWAQPGAVSNDTSATALRHAISHYREQVQDNSVLYQGREYREHFHKIEGHAFFLSSEWQQGKLMYKGRLYENVPMQFDISSGDVIVRHYNKLFKIQLYTEAIAYFSLGNAHFIRMNAEQTKGTPLTPGFYQLLYQHKSSVMASRSKFVYEAIQDNQVHSQFRERNTYYIEKEGIYYPVKNKASALKVLEDQKKEIRQYLKKSRIRYKKNPEHALVEMVKFYDQQHSSSQP